MRGKVDVQDAGGVDRGPASGRSGTLGGMPTAALDKTQCGDQRVLEIERGPDATSTSGLREQSDVREVCGPSPSSQATVLVPSSPSPAVQAPHSLPCQFNFPCLSPVASSFCKNCMQPEAPPVRQGY